MQEIIAWEHCQSDTIPWNIRNHKFGSLTPWRDENTCQVSNSPAGPFLTRQLTSKLSASPIFPDAGFVFFRVMPSPTMPEAI